MRLAQCLANVAGAAVLLHDEMLLQVTTSSCHGFLQDVVDHDEDLPMLVYA